MLCGGARERLRTEYNQGVYFAWLGARLSLADPKTFPKIERFQVRDLGPRPKQSRDEMLAVMRLLVARGNKPNKRGR